LYGVDAIRIGDVGGWGAVLVFFFVGNLLVL
jgi:hypothetical protein